MTEVNHIPLSIIRYESSLFLFSCFWLVLTLFDRRWFSKAVEAKLLYMHGKNSFKHMLSSCRRRGCVLESLISLFCDVIVNLNSKIVKQKSQPKIFFDSLDSYSVTFCPCLSCEKTGHWSKQYNKHHKSCLANCSYFN